MSTATLVQIVTYCRGCGAPWHSSYELPSDRRLRSFDEPHMYIGSCPLCPSNTLAGSATPTRDE
jgi:hypothetical protein